MTWDDEVFVPGRLCVLGEHTDWAAGYRPHSAATIPVGEAVVTGIEHGLYARVTRQRPQQPARVRYRTTLHFEDEFDVPLNDAQLLLAHAQSGSPFSYIAGVVYRVLERFPALAQHDTGLDIDNYRTTLPIKKGLSSSAALSVLVVRSFSRAFHLDLTVEDEMDLAYRGEITTPSRCGRLDQACAFGTRPIRMTFDGDRLTVRPIALACELHFVIVDLGAFKNTREILAALNACYPTPTTPVHQGVQRYLGHISPAITLQAIAAMERGDAAAVGRLLVEAQDQFDQLLTPACPSQLTSPVLHTLLAHAPLQPLIWGGKGVGSQGDGTAQLLARDAIAQQQVIDIIQRDFPQMQCLSFCLKPTT